MSVNRPVRIAIDALGGDYAPLEVIKGAVEAARKGDVQITLVGPEARIKSELDVLQAGNLPISVVDATECILEGEPPATAMRQKRNATIVVATKMVQKGQADAVIGAGPTGAVVASAMMILGTPEGIERPVAGGNFLGFSPNTVLLDAGGNIDCKPYHLLNFAVIGCTYAETMLHINNPTVAILSVGAEEGKGNDLVKQSYPIFKNSGLNFIGNVEGHDLITGKANVVVCDGFVGNILLKFCEGLGYAASEWLKKNLAGQLPEAEAQKLSHELFAATNSVELSGGGPLLGVNGVSVVMHGRSKAKEFAGAIDVAKKTVQSGLVEQINAELQKMKGKVNAG